MVVEVLSRDQWRARTPAIRAGPSTAAHVDDARRRGARGELVGRARRRVRAVVRAPPRALGRDGVGGLELLFETERAGMAWRLRLGERVRVALA